MRFYGQWDPPVDRFIFERYFPTVENGFFIEAGAFDGVTECSCKFFEQFRGWRGINIEPTPFNYNLLVKNRPNSVNLRLALSSECGTKTFTQALHPQAGQRFGNGSLEHQPHHRRELEEMGCGFEQFEVETITYAELIRRQNVERVDLMVLDVEGHELSVLEGMRGCAVLPKVFCVEHGQLGPAALVRVLGAMGYRFDTSLFANSYFLRE